MSQFWLILCLFLRFEKLLTNDFFWSYYIETNVQSLYLKFSVWFINWSLIGCKMWGNRGLPRLLAVWQFLVLKEIHLKMSFSIIFSQNHHIFFILAVVSRSQSRAQNTKSDIYTLKLNYKHRAFVLRHLEGSTTFIEWITEKTCL